MKELECVAEIEVSYTPTNREQVSITSPQDAYDELVKFFPKQTIALQEKFVVMYLNNNNIILGVYELSKGGITSTVVDIRLLFSVALKVAATNIILAHNHPTGNLKPSKADLELTQKIKEAGKFLDITLTDHLIISPKEKFYSFADEGIYNKIIEL